MSAERKSPEKTNNPPLPGPSLLHAVVYGRVQGVGFRQFVAQKAAALGLSGTVRNLADGSSVEVFVSGPKHSLDTLLGHLKRGPQGSHVLHVDVRWEPPGDVPSGFFILPG